MTPIEGITIRHRGEARPPFVACAICTRELNRQPLTKCERGLVSIGLAAIVRPAHVVRKRQASPLQGRQLGMFGGGR